MSLESLPTFVLDPHMDLGQRGREGGREGGKKKKRKIEGGRKRGGGRKEREG